ncbi:Pr6Pr family membrane protein [Nubsella zeaxanthinifaciens]|uniref:Pr6Pr family membrane protein n=1 Tax=Nubsella zeaxanthinifaciens TaxID=392412 RepID=UPI003D031DA6
MEKKFLAAIAIVAWFALIGQFYLQFNSGVAPKPELLVRFFSYFTIQSNLLIAIASTSIVLLPKTALGVFFSRQTIKTALTVYILVVALVYNVVLRFLWTFIGWGALVNELLHVVVPLLFLIYWSVFVVKRFLKWSNLWWWLSYPLVYCIVVMLRGNYSGFYPYPFLNMDKLGLQSVMVNCLAVTALFAVLSVLFIAIGKRQAKRV